MALVILITKAEAATALPAAIYPEWDALTDDVKDHHIEQASLYTQTHWSCSDEDFETPTLSDDAKKAVALYAEASRAGNLYDAINAVPSTSGTGAVKKKTLVAGSVQKSEEYSEGSIEENANNPLQMAEDLFGLIGCSAIKGGGNLTRV